ncbi:MAG: hypothetical protein Q9168_005095 [Polycauliona sp. 1 TL-2023]
MDMCRFSGIEDPEYKKIIGALDLIESRILESHARIDRSVVYPALTQEEKRLLLGSMWFSAADARYETIKTAHTKTCKWLLQRSEYRDWLDVAQISNHHGVFWIKGKPGSGKSTLLKFAVQNVRKEWKDAFVICFFFNARGEDMEKSTLGMYRSLLSQLLRTLPDLQVVLDKLSPVHDPETFGWQIDRVQDLLAAAIQRLGERRLFCFIDALDESDEDQIRDLVNFLEGLGRLTASSSIGLRFCLSSRHYPNVSIRNRVEMILEGQEGHDEDISKFLDSELKVGSAKVSKPIRDEIAERASGVFLWVALVVQILNKEYDRGHLSAIRRRLKEIPDGLDKLFGDMLTRDKACFEELILCLEWILHARRPLKREELYYAILSGTVNEQLTSWDQEEVTVEVMDNFILNCSKGLFETTKSKQHHTVQFIHESVRDFLLGENGITKLRAGSTSGQSHERLMQCCKKYAEIDISQDFPDSLELEKASDPTIQNLRQTIRKKYPFLEYSVHNVLWHTDQADRVGISQKQVLVSFDITRWVRLDNMLAQYQTHRHTIERKPSSMLLYILIEKNLRSLVQTYGRSDREHPLIFCQMALNDFKVDEQMLQALLRPTEQPEAYKTAFEKVISLWPSFFDTDFTRFLPWVAFNGQFRVLRALYDIERLDVESNRKTNRWNLWLVDRDRKYEQGQPLLSLAATNGHDAIVELLLDDNAKPNFNNSEGESPLTLAASKGHENVVKLLVKHEADINFLDRRGRSPLILATAHGHEAVAELLLDKTSFDRLNGDLGRTVLSLAAENGLETVARLLLGKMIPPKQKLNLEVNYGDGKPPLMSAASCGHAAVAKLLLEKGASLNYQDAQQRTPMMVAAANGHEAVVKLFMSNSADFDDKETQVIRASDIAAEAGHQGVVDMLKVHVDAFMSA